jgi:hypothetical protein
MRLPRRHLVGAIALIAWLFAQWTLFSGYVSREIAWAYPGGADQVATLARAYQTNEVLRTQGLFAGIREGVGTSGASGVLLPLQAALFQQALGRTRLAGLAVGFAYFAAFQVALVLTLLWLSGRWSVAWLGLGLLLSAHSPFFVVGGIADLRQDLCALALLGTFTCAAVRSRAFALTGWSVAAGAVAVLLIAMRTLTVVYLGGILGAFTTLVWWRSRRAPEGDAWRSRRWGLACVTALLALAVVVLVGARWETIRAYYVVGHLTGSDRLLHDAGVRGLADALLFYPRSFARDHAGGPLVGAAVLVVAAAAAARWRHPPTPESTGATGATLALAAIACAVPFAVLTADVARSSSVVGIVLGPAVWIVMLAVVRLSGAVAGAALPEHRERTLAVLAAGALALGLYTQWSFLQGPGRFAGREAEVQSVKDLHATVARHSRARGWTAPVVTVDRLAESLIPSLATTESAERLGFVQRVRFGVWKYGAVSRGEAEASIDRSDFVVLTGRTGALSFPFDVSMQELHPALVERCARAHEPVGRFRFASMEVTLYERRADAAR